MAEVDRQALIKENAKLLAELVQLDQENKRLKDEMEEL